MRRFFEIVAVIVLAVISSLLAVVAVLFPAPGVRALAKRLAIRLSRMARNI